MARTPLFAMIQRCLRNAQSSLDTGVPLLEILDRAAEARVIVGAGIAGLTAGYRLAKATDRWPSSVES